MGEWRPHCEAGHWKMGLISQSFSAPWLVLVSYFLWPVGSEGQGTGTSGVPSGRLVIHWEKSLPGQRLHGAGRGGLYLRGPSSPETLPESSALMHTRVTEISLRSKANRTCLPNAQSWSLIFSVKLMPRARVMSGSSVGLFKAIPLVWGEF